MLLFGKLSTYVQEVAGIVVSISIGLAGAGSGYWYCRRVKGLSWLEIGRISCSGWLSGPAASAVLVVTS